MDTLLLTSLQAEFEIFFEKNKVARFKHLRALEASKPFGAIEITESRVRMELLWEFKLRKLKNYRRELDKVT